jgi:prepilin-type N-terminal cleavage/methylation domain-containing protein
MKNQIIPISWMYYIFYMVLNLKLKLYNCIMETKLLKYNAFTLAEVLITLLVIGVVASLVIPSIINDTNKAEYVTKLKKEYAILQQAYKLLIIDNGGSILNDPNFNCSGTCNTFVSANAMNEFADKLNVIKNCGNGYGCWYTSFRRYLGGTVANSNLEADWGIQYGKARLSDGTFMMLYINDTRCNTSHGPVGNPLYGSICGEIHIDVNGATGPNQIGRDHFYFWITRNGIFPDGMNGDTYSCDISSTTLPTSKGCAYKVLSEGAMNY